MLNRVGAGSVRRQVAVADALNQFELILRSRVRRLCRQHTHLSDQDVDDIIADISLVLVQRLPDFNSARSSLATYCTRIIDSQISNAARKCKSRLNMSATSGQQDAEIAEHQRQAHLGYQRRSDLELAELRIDIDRILSSLDSHDLDLLRLLPICKESAAAKKLGRSRRSVRDDVLRIRGYFQSHAMEEYL